MQTTSLERYPGNPILKPEPLHPWEALNVFNAAAVYQNNLFHMLYRAQGGDYVSSIGYAVSADGYHWLRLDQPVFPPSGEFELRGVEDPRLTYIDGKFYMVYVAYSPSGILVSLAESENLIAWKRLGVILPGEVNKDAALFPEKINGRYCLLHRRPPDIWLAYSTDLVHWTDHQKVLSPRPGAWDEVRIGIAGPPLRTDEGWLQIYHGVDRTNAYRLSAFLMDLADPTCVKARLAQPILVPEEPWEIKGDVPNVVFSCGQVVKDDTLFVYYGGADRVMAVATCSLTQLMLSF